MAQKKPFGGMTIDFGGRKESIESVFGTGALKPSDMTKKLWSFIKSKKLIRK
ncbi:MAG: hypothetical protein HYT87_14905 [Nitrospirae bacterium]|nr:hypothetical protein [Nitrospirota bacterium]